MITCALTLSSFELSVLEKKLLAEFDMSEPTILPHLRTRHLGAFWPNWSLHKRKCDKTGREIISVFRPGCPYPVWHKDEWNQSANPPRASLDFNASFFSQAEKLFRQCPIPHNSGTNNENCEFTDDQWYSKNCYLSHNGYKCENVRYCGARVMNIRDCLYCVSSFDLEKCIDCVQCDNCYAVVYGLYLRNCRESAFCYDCRNCADCILCFNLRNKQYCIGNKQLTKEQYEAQKQQFEYLSLSGYAHCKKLFQKMMQEIAWHRCQYVDFCEGGEGNYIDHVKNCENTFFYKDGEDTCNNIRGVGGKTLLDTTSAAIDCERMCRCSAVQLQCYDVRCSFQLTEARFVDYSAYSSQIENCYGCCGLLKGKFCIFNTPYSQHEYTELRQKLIHHMKSTGEWGQIFPGTFAPNPYDDSWSSFYFPLSSSEQEKLGFFSLPNSEPYQKNYKNITDIPLTPLDSTVETTQVTYWDEISQKPFQILTQDINLCRELSICLPHTYYMRRIQENFRWMAYDGTLRSAKCAKSGIKIQTSWPSEYDGRILSEPEYIKIIA